MIYSIDIFLSTPCTLQRIPREAQTRSEFPKGQISILSRQTFRLSVKFKFTGTKTSRLSIHSCWPPTLPPLSACGDCKALLWQSHRWRCYGSGPDGWAMRRWKGQPARETYTLPHRPPQTFSTPSRPWETPKISHSSLRHTDARTATHITTRVPPDLCSLVKVFMWRTQKKRRGKIGARWHQSAHMCLCRSVCVRA